MGYDVEVCSLNIVESFPENLPCKEVASYIANQKMNALKEIKADSNLLLTADTTVIIENKILGKPLDEAHSRWMLNQLSGKQHTVNTAVEMILHGRIEKISSYTSVFFNVLSEQEIEYYISNFHAFDKAGSYGIQDWIGLIAVNKIEGSYSNVVGLPTDECFVSIQKLINS
jgi:septum formation protein